MQVSVLHSAQIGMFACPCCDNVWKDEIPPMWMGRDGWPICRPCGVAKHDLDEPMLLEGDGMTRQAA